METYSLKKNDGFTFLELLIVMLILGALAAVAIPAITQKTVDAKYAACDFNLATINLHVEKWYADKGSYPASIEDICNEPDYFPNETPVCPVSIHAEYSLNALHRAECSH